MARHSPHQIGRPALKGKEDSGQDGTLLLYSSTFSCATATRAVETMSRFVILSEAKNLSSI